MRLKEKILKTRTNYFSLIFFPFNI